MRRIGQLAVLLIALVVLAEKARAADRNWVLGLGAGPLYPNATDGEFLGPAASAWVAAPLQPWFLAGIELGWYRVDGDQGLVWSADNIPHDVEDRVSLTANAIFRMQFPLRKGLSPFVAAGVGMSRSSGGDVHFSDPGSTPEAVYPGQMETVWGSSAEFGLRFTIPGAWPDPEIAVRKLAWAGDHEQRAVQPRFAVVW